VSITITENGSFQSGHVSGAKMRRRINGPADIPAAMRNALISAIPT
jgi:hypothetical protein